MNNGEKLIDTAIIFAVSAVAVGLVVRHEKKVDEKLMKRRTFEAEKRFKEFADRLDAMARPVLEFNLDPNRNSKTKLVVHSNHGDVNLNKDLGQK